MRGVLQRTAMIAAAATIRPNNNIMRDLVRMDRERVVQVARNCRAELLRREEAFANQIPA